MPCALGFGDALDDAAVFQNDIMRGYVGACGPEPRQPALDVGHAGVVQHDHVRQTAFAPFSKISRRTDIGNNGGIRRECLPAGATMRYRQGATRLWTTSS